MPKTLYVIDGHGHIYAAYYAPMRQQLTSPSGEPTKATYIFTTALMGLIQRRRPDLLAVAMDSKTPTFRNKMYADYKAQRPPMPDDMPTQIGRIEQILEAMGIPVLRVDGYEADDVIGTLVRKAGDAGYECFICSSDKDVLQLVGEHTSIYDMKNDVVTDRKAMIETMGVTPAQFIDCLALQGDASDNVPGVPDVGPKTALAWIQKYGSIDNLYAHIDEITGKRGDNLRKFKETLALSKRLVTIDREVPVRIDYDEMALKTGDRDRLTGIFQELGFSRLLSQIQRSDAGQVRKAGDRGAGGGGQGSGKPKSATTTADKSEIRNPPQQRRTSPKSEVWGLTPAQTASAKTAPHVYELVDTPAKFDRFVTELAKQPTFAVDTETTSVFPMRADLVGLSFCWQPAKAYYLPIRAPMGTAHLDLEAVRQRIGPILADEKVKKTGQNIKYDLLVLRNAGLPIRGIHFDTMVASYCLDPGRTSHSLDNMALDFLNYEGIPIAALIGKGRNQLTFDMVDTAAACEYSGEDADITFQLYLYFNERLAREPGLEKLFYEVEMPLVAVLADMEYDGVSLDAALLRAMSDKVDAELTKLAEQIHDLAGGVFNIDSPKQLAEVLFDRLKLPSSRVGKTGRSTDAAVLEELIDEHAIVAAILQHRALAKLKNTYIDKLGAIIHPRTGRVHASFNQTVAATGRLSSSDPNLQNIPIRTELGRQIRAAFIAKEPTDCILSADYSQIELRLLAHFSHDKALLAAFAADQDIHRFVASQIYNVPVEEVTSEMRSRCKAVNFGIIYGQGAIGLARTTGLSTAEAKKFIEDYFARYAAIRGFLNECIAKARRTGYAETILHRRRKILNLNSTNGGKRSQAERLAVNTVIQGSAADLIKVAMVNIHRQIEREHLPVKMILQIHDELVFELPTAQAERHAAWISREMTTAIRLDVPLKVDVSYGPSWLAQ